MSGRLKHKRTRGLKESHNGWTRWVQPISKGYMLECCDCGLVHRIIFRVRDGTVIFKAQRAPAYTRRARKADGRVMP